MTDQLTVWTPRESVTISKQATMSEIITYSKQLSDRELNQIESAFLAENYEIGAIFLWSRTMAELKKWLGTLGMNFVGEMLDRADITDTSTPINALTDSDAVALAEKLGMFPPTQAMKIRTAMTMVTHYSAAPGDEEPDREMMAEDAMLILRACVQSVLGHEQLEEAIEFSKFRTSLEEQSYTAEDPMLATLASSPYFFIRTTSRILLATIKTASGAQLEHSLANANSIIPKVWQILHGPDRWQVGRAYSEVYNDGNKVAAAGLRKLLLQVQGFDYVPEDLRSKVFAKAAANLKDVHFGMDNFHNEPRSIKNLADLGTVIPIPALSKVLTAVLCVRLGNIWGISWAAQNKAKEILDGISKDRWKYYFDECLPGDETILEKLSNSGGDPITRWCNLVLSIDLTNHEFKDDNISKILEHSKNKNIPAVKEVALALLRRLRG